MYLMDIAQKIILQHFGLVRGKRHLNNPAIFLVEAGIFIVATLLITW